MPVGKSCFSLIDWLASPYIPPVYQGDEFPTLFTPFAYGLDPVIAFRFAVVGEKLTKSAGAVSYTHLTLPTIYSV